MNYRAEFIDRVKAARARMGMGVPPRSTPVVSTPEPVQNNIIISIEPVWNRVPSPNVSPLEIMAGFIIRPEPSLKQIKVATAARFGISMIEMESQRRSAAVSRARQAGYWLSRTLTRRSLPQIAQAYFRDHSSVLHGINACQQRMKYDAEYRATIHLLADSLTARPPFDTHYPGA